MSQIDSQTQVLLVDDDPYLRKALSQTLDLAGLRVLGLDDARGLAARLPADFWARFSAAGAEGAARPFIWALCPRPGLPVPRPRADRE